MSCAVADSVREYTKAHLYGLTPEDVLSRLMLEFAHFMRV